MSERKGINKYYPPDWDPSKVPKRQKTGNQDIKVRLMAPFSMRCLKCNEYIAERRKFNAKKEITKEMYMNFKIIRFHITCPRCNNKITFKTSPQTAGYITESGAIRNHEPKVATSKSTDLTTNKPETEEEILNRLEKEEQENQSYQVIKEKRKKNPFWNKDNKLNDGDGDLMENLEKRLQQQQRENEINDHLEQLQAKQDYIASQGGKDELMSNAQEKIVNDLHDAEALNDVEDDEIYKRAFAKFKQNKKTEESNEVKDEEVQKKEQKEPEVTGDVVEEVTKKAEEESVGEIQKPLKRASDAFNPKIIVKRKKVEAIKKEAHIPTSALSNLAGYSSDESD